MSKNITLNMYQNFRIKLDFKYYNDVRRFCWIFIDCTKMLQIDDIKEHIKKLFGINDPFDLFLNENEYLPPKENIQVLKENEIILVSPGSHLSNNQFNNLPLSIEFSSIDANKQELEGNFAYPEQIEELISQSGKNSARQEQLSNNFPAVLSSQQDLSTDTTNNFQSGEEMYDTSNPEILDTLPRRKRVRHRKKKTKVDTQLTEEDKPAKPKITNSIISSTISSCKHIRFDNVDNKIIVNDQFICPAPSNRVDTVHKLKNLLSLSKNAIPLTFENNRIKGMTCKKEKEEKENVEDTVANVVSKNINGNTASTERLEEVNKFLDIDFETYEVMVVKPKIEDIIAFKMLKIGTDYTPQMSNFIVAEVIFYCSEKSLYKLKILQGLSEVQVPIGKFTIMEETEERVLNDIITLHHAQIVKPRLVSNSDKAISSSN
ncbi:hypothetical protein QLX08_010903 [Tetragonisca angustula]|uniref:Coilin n=2 Tax=Tetragonisca angustula TaxID=166442 RepID=A0AAW0ZAI6_9HYME